MDGSIRIFANETARYNMQKIKQAISVIALALLIGACLLLMAWTQIERGCPITEPNCVYIVNQ
jgi:hypothetical protein